MDGSGDNVAYLHGEEGRALPHNLEMEQALLGAILVNNDALYQVQPFLKDEHFYEPLHARIYTVIIQLLQSGREATAVSVYPHLSDDDGLVQVGGKSYLGRLTVAAVTALHAEDYGWAIVDYARRRRLIEISDHLRQDAYQPGPERSADDVLADAEVQMASIDGANAEERTVWTIGESLRFLIDNHDRKQSGDFRDSMVPYGIGGLDEILGGIERGEMGLLAARPKMGKSMGMVEFAYNQGVRGLGVGIITPDMGHKSLSARLASSHLARKGSTIPYEKALKGRLDMTDRQAFVDAVEFIDDLPIVLDDAPAPTVPHIVSRIRKWQRDFRRQGRTLDIVYVDHIHICRAPKETRYSETAAVKAISNGLKEAARKTGVPILALCQLNRELEKRDDKRPMLADLRYAGDLEQDARWVIFMHRPWHYEKEKEPQRKDFKSSTAYEEAMADFDAERVAKERLVEFIVAKQNNGPDGIVQCEGELATNRLWDRV